MTRRDLIRANILALARNEARALALELDNDALARLTVVRALAEAARELTDEYGATGWLPVELRD